MEIRNVHSHRPAHLVQIAPTVATAGPALEHEEPMRLGIAKGPELVCGSEHEVDRIHGKVLGDPTDRRRDPRADAATRADLLRDEREVALGVGVSSDEAHVTADLRLERIQILESCRCVQRAFRPLRTDACSRSSARRWWRNGCATRTSWSSRASPLARTPDPRRPAEAPCR